jgi:hypothetical protein
MSTAADSFTVLFPEGYDARSEFETPSRGYLSGVVVRLGDGSRYPLFFMDPVRLQQELADYVREGRAYFAEPNLVILPEVTTESVKTAVQGLLREGFFEHLKPL